MKYIEYTREEFNELDVFCYKKASKEEFTAWLLLCIDKLHDYVNQGYGFNSARKMSGYEKAYKYYTDQWFFNWQENRKFMEAKQKAQSRRTHGVYYKLCNQNTNETTENNSEVEQARTKNK